MAVLLAGCVLVVLNYTLLAPALPVIMHEMDVSETTVQWLTSVYAMVEAIVIPMNLKSSQSKFRNGRACVWNGLTEKNERRYGVIDPDGREIYPFTLDEKVVFEGPVAAAVQDGRAGAISLDGKTVVPFAFDEVRVGDGIILCLRDGRISLYDYGGKKI